MAAAEGALTAAGDLPGVGDDRLQREAGLIEVIELQLPVGIILGQALELQLRDLKSLLITRRVQPVAETPPAIPGVA